MAHMSHTRTEKGSKQHTPGFRVCLPGPMLARLDALIDRANGETRSIVVRRALKEYMERTGQ